MLIPQDKYKALLRQNGSLTEDERMRIMEHQLTPYAGLHWIGLDAILCVWTWVNPFKYIGLKLTDIWCD